MVAVGRALSTAGWWRAGGLANLLPDNSVVPLQVSVLLCVFIVGMDRE
jgi:hypothetical protein